MNSHDLDLLVQKFLEGNCTDKEKQFLLQWYANFPSKEADNMDEIGKMLWTELKEKAALNPTEKQNRISHFSTVLKIAASVVLLIGLGVGSYFFISDTNTLQDAAGLISRVNKTGKIEILLLEDGSRISIQPNSEIRYPEHFTKDIREVHLTGEAFFEIAHDETHPFIVHARDVTTKVLGTSFTIKAYENEDVSVLVRTGKVSVTRADGTVNTIAQSEEVLLTPNQQIVYDRTTEKLNVSLAEKPEIVEEVPLLNKRFNKVPVTEIFEALEKAYKIDIQFDEEKMASCRLTTDIINVHDDLYDHVRFICHAIGVKYTVNDLAIVIEGRGCK